MSVITAPKLEAFCSSLNASTLPEIGALSTAREQAAEALQTLAFPTTRSEKWKYTRLGRIEREAWSFEANVSTDISALRIPNWEGWTAVFVNGFFNAELSSPDLEKSAYVQRIESATSAFGLNPNADVFEALNARYCSGGLDINVAKGQALEQPLHILHVATGDGLTSQPRHRFQVGENAQATVCLSFHKPSTGKHFSNVRLEGDVAQGGVLSLEMLEDAADDHYLINTQNIHQGKDSRFNIRTITTSGTLVRNTLLIAVDGEGCETNLFGTYSPRGKEHIDNATVVDHRVPNCLSNELYKGVLYDKSTGVFNGKVYVRPDAQLTNAFQSNNNILMSPEATMNSKPELEIYADDVQCSHGSTTGQFDEEAVFYLKARGLDDFTSRTLLIEAFRAEVIDAISVEAFGEYVKPFLK